MDGYNQTSCPECGVEFALRTAFEDMLRRSGKGFYCPNGHSLKFGASEADRLRRERDLLKQQMARLEEEKQIAWNTANAQVARAKAAEQEAKRLRARVGHGVCPCCNRTFRDLADHMKTKHPDMTVESEAEPPKPENPAGRKKRSVSPLTRQRMREAARARWQAKKAAGADAGSD